MATANIYNFPEQQKGMTFNGIIFNLKINGVAANLIKVEAFFKGLNGKIYTMTNVGNASITITGVPGEFKINDQIIDWDIGQYTYKIVTTLSNGFKKIYIKGSMKIS